MSGNFRPYKNSVFIFTYKFNNIIIFNLLFAFFSYCVVCIVAASTHLHHVNRVVQKRIPSFAR